MFIVIDGNDGAWKWTQVALLKKELEAKGKTVMLLDYPRYGNPATFFVEKYLNGGYGKDVSAKMASLFYALDRYDHKDEVSKYLQEYDFVISNRYATASMIHQAWKIQDTQEAESFLDWLFELEYEICAISKPDKVLFLDVPPEISIQLIEKKEQRDYIKWGSNKDIHEADENHLKNAYEKALYASEKFWWTRIQCVEDGKMLSIEEVQMRILKEIL